MKKTVFILNKIDDQTNNSSIMGVFNSKQHGLDWLRNAWKQEASELIDDSFLEIADGLIDAPCLRHVAGNYSYYIDEHYIINE